VAFEVIPAIDLLDGEVVRLERGDRARKTVYSTDPVGFAREFARAGATRLHVVDLNGAFEGRFANLHLVEAICRATEMRVELGGGIRSLASAEQAWTAGVSDVIIGTRAVEDPEFTRALLADHAGRVIIGIDAKDGKVATRGWVEAGTLGAEEFTATVAGWGCRRVIYTDIATDGMLTGPSLEATGALARAFPGLEIVASGGVARLEDLLALRDLGLPNLVGDDHRARRLRRPARLGTRGAPAQPTRRCLTRPPERGHVPPRCLQ
jgi:phosphoribosylformimino-5-aminoimidazole carboxamide ribotide isomerase